MKKYYLYLLLFVAVIGTTLSNSKIFGTQAMSAYFLFCFVAGLMGVVVFAVFYFYKKRISPGLSIPLISFGLLTIYVCVSGFNDRNPTFFDYYFVACFVYLLSLHTLNRYETALGNPLNLRDAAFEAIAGVALVQSIIVILQFLKVIRFSSELFACTGTWGNPNITGMFLAMSLFAVSELRYRRPQAIYRLTVYTILFFMLVAIALLKCRTAYLVTLVAIIFEIIRLYSIGKAARITHKVWMPGLLLLTIAIGITFVSISKGDSTSGRVTIWKNCLHLFSNRLATGYGFGSFEKTYNDYTIERGEPANDYVMYAYNDFLGLGIEGGLPAVILWALFILYVTWVSAKKARNRDNLLPVMISFLIMQTTNFGFQAVPAFVVFITYVGLQSFGPAISLKAGSVVRPRHKLAIRAFTGALIVVSTWSVIRIVVLGSAFATNARITFLDPGRAEMQFKSIANVLKGYPAYHERRGNLELSLNQFGLAAQQFSAGLTKSSDPELLLRMGYCFQRLKMYDSCIYYLGKASRLQPYKYLPRVLLLEIYQIKNDTTNVLATANEILAMPERIKSGLADNYRIAAKRILQSYSDKGER